MLARIAVAGVTVAVALLTACDSGGPAPHTTTITHSGTLSALPSTGPIASAFVRGPSGVPAGDWTVDLRQSVTTVQILFADLGGPLYAVTMPPGGNHPTATITGHTVAVTAGGGGDAIQIVLSRATSWRVQLSAGVSSLTVNAGEGTLAGLTLLAGVSSVDVTAGAPTGLVDVRETGGVSSLSMHLPDDTGVEVIATGGAGTVTLFGASHQGIPGGGTVATPGFAGRGYRIDAVAGISAVVVD